MRVVPALVVAAALVPLATGAIADPSSDATQYCTPGGGPLGAATDAEHDVLLSETPYPRGVRVSRVRVNGVSTRVLQAGPRAARDAVVFVHGNPGSSRDWDGLMPAGGRFARMVAFDMPGFGRSDRGGAPRVHTIKGAVASIQGVVRKLGVRRAVLVLHDFGGPWGLEWAVHHKRAFRATVLLNTGVLIDYVPHPLAVVWSTPQAGELQMAGNTRESFVAFIQAVEPRPLPDAFVQRMYDYYDRAERCAILRYYRSLRQTYRTLGPDQARALRPLDRPALVIWGKRDPFIPPSQAPKQRQAFPHARIVYLPNSGHWVHIDAARKVRALSMAFLRPKLRARRAGGFRVGSRLLRVRVRVRGVLPAYRVVARLRLHGKLIATSGRRVTVRPGRRVLRVRLDTPLRARRYVLRVRARGLPVRVLRWRPRAATRPQ
jgi:pimeloyl-ACP methyl ester carboxylesterase